jgi:antitoxin component YwqK of YwqJK toxin-antitoxin module
MKNKSFFTLSIIFLLLFAITANGQGKINQFDLNGKRTGVWKKYYTNKNIRYQGKFKAGKEIGIFKYYSAISSKHPIVIKTFNANNTIATVKFYSVEGVLESTGEMQGKNRIGKWLYFQPDGKTLMIEENYENGVLNGEFKSYYKTGQITEILNYKNGELHGNTKRYADNGALLDDLNYKEGKLQGLAKYYNIEGQLIYTGNYENDEKVGEWEYFENGKKENVNKLKQ